MKRFFDAIAPLIARTASLNGITFNPQGGQPLALGESVKAYLQTCLNAADPEEIRATIRKFLDGDPATARSINELRVEQISNFLLPSIAMTADYFNVINLGPADRPVIQVLSGQQEIPVRIIAADGQPRRIRISPSATEELVPLYTIWSDDFVYRPMDLYHGDVSQNALRTVNLAFDMACKVDALAKTLLDTLFGAFVTSGSKLARTYVPHSAIVTANLPSTNDITLTGNTGSTKFRVAALKAILTYCDSWGEAWPDGKLAPTGKIWIPSSEATDLLDEFAPTNSASTDIASEVQNNYTTVSYGGRTWTLAPTNRLPKGVCYPVLNKRVGTVYFKPSFDATFDTGNNPEALRKNEATRTARKAMGTYAPESLRVNCLRVRYTT